MSKRYILRLDDASEKRDVEKWDRIEELLDKYDIKPLVGVIPKCEDPMMDKYPVDNDFWNRVQAWENKGWVVAMHGYRHVYDSNDGGINPVNNFSEFAGHPLEVQRERIKNGVKIFSNHGIEPKIFFAPGHTFDNNTLEALRLESNIRIISDTVAWDVYTKDGFTFIPQQSGRVRRLPFRTTTFCYHPNTMDYKDVIKMQSFLKRYRMLFAEAFFWGNNREKQQTITDRMIEKGYFESLNYRRRVAKLFQKVNEVGFRNTFIGGIKMLHYSLLQKKYGFLKWSISPYELRPYIQTVAEYISASKCRTVVDVGCGLGELLRHTNADRRIGIDIDDKSILVAKRLDRNNSIIYKKGSFTEVGKGHQIDILVSLNFMHEKNEAFWQPIYERVLCENNVDQIIVDSVEEKNNQLCLDWRKILPGNYFKCKVFGPYNGNRYVYVYCKGE